MKITKRVKYTVEKDEFVEMVCDICGTRVADVDWPELGIFENVQRTEVSYTYGYQDDWEGRGHRNKQEYDICNLCFTKHLVPFLASLGATPTIVETEW